MKKYILLALLSVICLVSFSQPVTQRGTTAVTVQDARLYAQFNFKPPVYEDTTAANLQKGIDSCGSLIFVKATSQYFYRACEPKKWVPIVGGSNNTIVNFESRIVSGSAVWRTGMIYDVTFCTYIIGGVTYTSSPTFVTLATADSSNPRVDVIYLDTLGNVGVLTGNPSPDPVKPVVNPLSQIELTHIDISAQGSTPAGVSSDIIYNENLQQPTEWNTSITAGTLNPNYTTNPYIGTKSFLFNETAVGQSAGFSYGSNSVELDSVRLLSFYLRQNSVPQTSISIDGTINPLMIIRLYNDGAVVSGDIGIRRGFYGYERDTINKYQLIAIDLSTIPFANDVQFIDSISVTMFSNIKLGFQIDYMRWQFGGGTPPPTLTNFWSLDGNDIADKPGAVLGTTSKNPLSIVVNGNEVMNLDLENQVNLVGNVPLVTDTTAYKPLVINTSGTVAQVGNWGTAGVSQVTGVAPVFSSGGTTPAISMSIASSTTDGYLTQTDWTTFNGKISPADTLNLSARINNNYDSIIKISDTSFYLRKANGTTKDTVLFGNAIVYTENPIMARVSNDSNIIYFNPDTAAVWRGGGSGSQNLQQVTDVGNTTTNTLIIDDGVNKTTFGSFGTSTEIIKYENNLINQNYFQIYDSTLNGGIKYSNTSGQEYEIGAGISSGLFNSYKIYASYSDDYVNISDNKIQFQIAAGSTNQTIIPVNYSSNSGPDTTYFPVIDNIPDTLATLRDLRDSVAGLNFGSGTDSRISKWSADTLKNSSVSDNDTTVVFTKAINLSIDSTLSRSRIYANSPYIQGTATSGDRITLGTIGGNVPSTTNEVIVGIGDVSSATGTKNGLNITGRLTHTAGSTQEINYLNILPSTQQTGTSTNKIRGLYYNPTFNTSFGGSNIAMQTTSGDIVLGGMKTRDTNTDSIAVFHNDTIKKRAYPNPMLNADTLPIATFSMGSGASADTSIFTTSVIAGSFYNDGSDTLFITSYRVALQGTSPSITPDVWFNDSLNVTAGGTKLVNSPSAITNTTTGTSVTPNTNKIPPGNFVFVRFSAVNTKPTYFTLTLFGTRINK
jgi:hypothetical protein